MDLENVGVNWTAWVCRRSNLRVSPTQGAIWAFLRYEGEEAEAKASPLSAADYIDSRTRLQSRGIRAKAPCPLPTIIKRFIALISRERKWFSDSSFVEFESYADLKSAFENTTITKRTLQDGPG